MYLTDNLRYAQTAANQGHTSKPLCCSCEKFRLYYVRQREGRDIC